MSISRVKGNGFWLALLVVALVALMGWLTAAGPAQADSTAEVTIGSATVAPGESTTVDISVAGGSGKTVGVVTLNVAYDGSLLTQTSCTATGGVCNDDANPVQFQLTNSAGLDSLGTISFLAGSTEGVADLTLIIVQCADETGEDITCSASNGSITIQTEPPEATATLGPDETPEATATPDGDETPDATEEPTVGGPPTGTGGLTEGSNGVSGWLIAALAGAGFAALAGFGALRLRTRQ